MSHTDELEEYDAELELRLKRDTRTSSRCSATAC